ncbi:hypothetical protein [Streptomyces sp. NPDC050264]
MAVARCSPGAAAPAAVALGQPAASSGTVRAQRGALVSATRVAA